MSLQSSALSLEAPTIVEQQQKVDKNIDIVSLINGNFGPWQLRTVLIVFLCKIPSAWFMACIIYTAPTPQTGDYYCKPTGNSSIANTTNPFIRVKNRNADDNRHTDRQFAVDVCSVYEEKMEHKFATRYFNYSNPLQTPADIDIVNMAMENLGSVVERQIKPCANFEHNTEYTSLVTQFNLVCSRQLLVSVTQSFHALGALLGGLLTIPTLKSISPRRLMLLGMVGQIFCGNLTGLVNTFQLHVYFRCLASLFSVLVFTSGHAILTDITGGTAKTTVITLFELFWSIGIILLPCISIFFDSWSYLYMAISTSLVILIFLHRWVTDSPRWLLRHNQIEKALQILLESATFNNREIPIDLERKLMQYAKTLQQEIPTSYWSIWDKKVKRMFLVAMHLIWFNASILFNVMLLMIRSLGIEYIHVNTASLGFAEMIGVLLGLYFVLYTRRCWLWSGYLLIAASILTYIVWLVPQTIKESRRIGIHMIFWIFLKLSNSSSISVLNIFTGYLVETEKRALLMLSVVTFSRMGLIVGPFISVFAVFSKLIPISIFAALALMNGILFCFLNIHYWNEEQPQKAKVPSPNTYRRNSSIELLRRSSTYSEISHDDNTNDYDNKAFTISISDLWRIE